MTYEKKVSKPVVTSKHLTIADNIIGNLENRVGFRDIFEHISPVVMQELKVTIAGLIALGGLK